MLIRLKRWLPRWKLGKPFFCVIVSLFPSLVYAVDLAHLEALAHSQQWLRLLQHQNKNFGKSKSRVVNDDFFLAKNGRYDPTAELKATVQAFSDSSVVVGPLGHHAQCAFPARYIFLKNNLVLPAVEMHCEVFENWRQRLNVKSVSLVFSSAFSGSPASMFGHTFLKMNISKAGSSNGNEISIGASDLLSYSASYAAIVPKVNPFTYAVKGLFGGFEGRFSIMPHYLKVREYAATENRDLWEYELELNDEEIELLIAHLWELFVLSSYRYYFLDENCSFQILSLLEAVRPDWDLIRPHEFVLLPNESVRRVANIPGAVRQVRFFPSQERKAASALDALSATKRQDAKDIFYQRRSVDSTEDMQVLGAVVEKLHFQKFRDYHSFPDEMQSLLQDVLLAQATNVESSSIDSSIPAAIPDNRPDKGHGVSRVGIWRYASGQSGGSIVKSRLGYHHMMDDDFGFEPNLGIEYLGVDIRFSDDNPAPRLHKGTLLDIESHTTTSLIGWRPSWRVSLGYEDLIDLVDDDCQSKASFKSDIGTSSMLANGSVLSYVFLGAYTWSCHEFSSITGIRPATSAGIYYKVSRIKINAEVSRGLNLVRGVPNNYQSIGSFFLRWYPAKDWAIGFDVVAKLAYQPQWKFGFDFYF